MNLWMWTLFFLIICQRVIELNIAKSNERWIKERGGFEKYPKHYKWFIIIHVSFFISILIEVYFRDRLYVPLHYSLLLLFVATQAIRIWCIKSLGRFWNTKILILPGVTLIRKGPYKYVKHPNYIIVGLELFIIPLLFKAYVVAFIFPMLHIILLMIRIPSEEKALAKVVNTTIKGDGP